MEQYSNKHLGLEPEAAESLEVDSDRNDDPGREALLDDAYDDWYRSIGHQVKEKLFITNVPAENVFDTADGEEIRGLVSDSDDQA